MQHHDDRDVGIGGHLLEEAPQRLERAGGRTDADDQERASIPFYRLGHAGSIEARLWPCEYGTMAKLRILLADDHETVREGLKSIVNAQPDMEVVGEVADGETAVARAVLLSPDIVVMDVSMPVLNGLNATAAMATRCPGTKVLALTRHADDGYLHQVLRAGASGYVLKQSRSAELLHAIRAIAAGGTYLDPAIAGRVINRRSATAPIGSAASAPNLSSREEEVTRLVAWGYSNKEIAAQLDLSVKTIETHKANASQKLGLSHRIDLVRYALERGWLRDDDG
jgi:two-component system, NarL family, response regulator NreC